MSSIIDTYFKEGEYYIERTSYSDRERLAVCAYTKDLEPIGSLTVNLEKYEVAEDEAFLDVNNLPGIETVLVRNGLGKLTGDTGYSGFCAYPKFKFNLDRLDEMTKQYTGE